jgi:hypothetical protein
MNKKRDHLKLSSQRRKGEKMKSNEKSYTTHGEPS